MKEAILERFLRYVAVTSQSDGKAGVVPSTEGQRKLAGMLAEELAELGFVNIEISEYSVLTALLPGNLPDNKASDGRLVLPSRHCGCRPQPRRPSSGDPRLSGRRHLPEQGKGPVDAHVRAS